MCYSRYIKWQAYEDAKLFYHNVNPVDEEWNGSGCASFKDLFDGDNTLVTFENLYKVSPDLLTVDPILNAELDKSKIVIKGGNTQTIPEVDLVANFYDLNNIEVW